MFCLRPRTILCSALLSIFMLTVGGATGQTPPAQNPEPAKQPSSATPTKRLFIADYVISGVVGSTHADSSGNAYGSAGVVGRNITLEATDDFMKHCPAVTVTNDRSAADYVLQPNKGSSTLYKKNGDVAYVSHAKVKVSNLVKDVCGYIQTHQAEEK
jgi:hypothetical protein